VLFDANFMMAGRIKSFPEKEIMVGKWKFKLANFMLSAIQPNKV
jgi:hypothetical protein